MAIIVQWFINHLFEVAVVSLLLLSAFDRMCFDANLTRRISRIEGLLEEIQKRQK